jgi:predicted ATPase
MLDVLKVAASFGSQLDQAQIEYVLDFPIASVLTQAKAMNILVTDERTGVYEFGHDGIQKAVYELIPADGRELFHLEAGRRLWRRLKEVELEQHLFVLLSQMIVGKRLITREKERYAIASLCLHAGKKAAKLSTFRLATVYLNFGIGLLGDRGWRDEYDLTLASYNAAAEMNMCTGHFDAMEPLLESVLKNSRSLCDRIQAHSTKIYALGMADRQDDALDLGLGVLADLGVKLPWSKCKLSMKSELKAVHRLLRGKSNAQLMRLPYIEDQDVLACLQILSVVSAAPLVGTWGQLSRVVSCLTRSYTQMYMHAILIRRHLAPFIALRMMKLTLIHGLSLLAPSVFSSYGIVCMSVLHDADTAFRFGELAMELNDKLNVKVYLPRIYAAFYGCIHHWKRPLRDTLPPLQIGRKVGMLTGDLEYSSLNANLYCYNAFDAGVPLQEIERMWTSFQRDMVTNSQKALHRMSVPCMQAIQYAIGHLDNTDETEELARQADGMKRHNTASFVRMYQMKTAYLFNDYERADCLSRQVTKHIWIMPPTHEIVSMSFTSGMIALAMAAKGKRFRQNIWKARQMIAALNCMARACPANCLDKKFLLKAELAAVRGQEAKAYELYTCAIALAHDNGFTHIQAMANERCARFFITHKKSADAILYFRQAVTLYEEWGATRKVNQLLEEGRELFDEPIR